MTFMQWVVHNMATIGLVVFGLAAVFGVAWLAAENDVGDYEPYDPNHGGARLIREDGFAVSSTTGAPWV
jgi:hypothetical protein